MIIEEKRSSGGPPSVTREGTRVPPSVYYKCTLKLNLEIRPASRDGRTPAGDLWKALKSKLDKRGVFNGEPLPTPPTSPEPPLPTSPKPPVPAPPKPKV